MDPDSQLAILDAFADNGGAARRDGGGARGRGRARRPRWRRSRPTRAPGPSARTCCASSWPSWTRRGRCPARTDAGRRARADPRRREVPAASSRGEEALYAGDGAVGERDRGRGARARAAGPAGSGAGAAGRAAARRRRRRRGRRPRPRPLRARRPLRTRSGWPRSRSGCSCFAALPQTRRHRGRAGRAARGAGGRAGGRSARSRRGSRRARRRSTRRRRARGGAAAALSERAQAAARTLERKIDETLRELGLRPARLPSRSRRGSWARRGATGSASCSRPTRARSRGRWPGSPRAASCRGSCWRSSGRWRGPTRR